MLRFLIIIVVTSKHFVRRVKFIRNNSIKSHYTHFTWAVGSTKFSLTHSNGAAPHTGKVSLVSALTVATKSNRSYCGASKSKDICSIRRQSDSNLATCKSTCHLSLTQARKTRGIVTKCRCFLTKNRLLSWLGAQGFERQDASWVPRSLHQSQLL